jgi:hypothetical protein
MRKHQRVYLDAVGGVPPGDERITAQRCDE